MKTLTVPIQYLSHAKGLPVPKKATAGSAGLDLFAANYDPVIICSGDWAFIPTGIAIALPVGYEGQVRPRSGLAGKKGVTVLNSPGTIDSDYRGQIQVILINFGDESYTILRGQRIAQLVIAPVISIDWAPESNLGLTARGTKGFGSTGMES